jgi:F-type H+-transporting ATPase subunit b
MLIDWFTVGAQALNFILLVWLLKRFLYKPIINAVDTREKRIAAELADADATRTEAQKERAQYQLKSEQFDQRRAELLSQATQEVSVERQRLLDEARLAADALATRRRKALLSDAQRLNQAIRYRTQREVFSIAGKALADLATTSLEERMVEVFARQVRTMSGSAKNALAQALETASGPALVRSAFDLPAAQRIAVKHALNENFSSDVQVRFETAPELISGIELSTNGQKIAWSIADYLASLERSVADLLSEDNLPASRAEPQAANTAETPKQALTEAVAS